MLVSWSTKRNVICQSRFSGRRRADSNRWCSFCRAVPYHLATSPYEDNWERETGIEPATFSLARRCSTTEPLPHISCVRKIKISYSWYFVNCFLHHPLPDKTNNLCLANRLLFFPHEVSHRHLASREFIWPQDNHEGYTLLAR